MENVTYVFISCDPLRRLNHRVHACRDLSAFSVSMAPFCTLLLLFTQSVPPWLVFCYIFSE